MKLEEMIIDFLRKDVGSVLVTDSEGEVLLRDDNVTLTVNRQWKLFCPPIDTDAVVSWEFWDTDSDKVYRILTGSAETDDGIIQIHLLTDVSEVVNLYRATGDMVREKGEKDGLTGLFNKGKFIELMDKVFPKAESLAVYNMDVNNLKKVNDTMGHEAGDALIKKAADSIKKVCGDNVYGFRMGGDEFLLIACDFTKQEANELMARWEMGLVDINAASTDNIPCVVACGMAYGSGDFSPEKLMRLADSRMYEDKKAKKQPGEEIR